MRKDRKDVQKAYRQRCNEERRTLLEAHKLVSNIPAAIRFAALKGNSIARKVVAETDEQTLKNLEVFFYEAAKSGSSRTAAKNP